MPERKYKRYVFTDCLEQPNLPDHTPAKTAFSFRGARQIPGANANFGWSLISKPMFLEKAPHTHEADEYMVFLGGDPMDWAGSFDAEIDFYMGEEQEYYLIDKPTTVFIPKGLPHTPLNFRKISRPLFFGVILLTPRFSKNMDGKTFTNDGSGYEEAPKIQNLDLLP